MALVMPPGYFSSTFFLLGNEGHLIRAALSGGLTDLRSANIGNPGKYYSAFFNLSIGLERLFKLILILEHMAKNSLATPTADAVRGYGHDLLKLSATVTALAPSKHQSALEALALDSIERDILRFLSHFARSARYHNLDALAAGEKTQDPLSDWAKILQRILGEDVSKRQRDNAIEKAAVVAALVKDYTIALYHDLERHSLSLDDLYLLPRLYEIASRYAVLHTFGILKPVVDVLYAVSDEAQEVNREVSIDVMHVPHMIEFLGFIWAERSMILRRRKWP